MTMNPARPPTRSVADRVRARWSSSLASKDKQLPENTPTRRTGARGRDLLNAINTLGVERGKETTLGGHRTAQEITIRRLGQRSAGEIRWCWSWTSAAFHRSRVPLGADMTAESRRPSGCSTRSRAGHPVIFTTIGSSPTSWMGRSGSGRSQPRRVRIGASGSR